MRSVIEIETDAGVIVGTTHRPAAGEAVSPASRRGVLFANFGPVARAGVGDLAAHLADAVAADGHLACRVDLPGIGDSDGELPQREEPFFAAVHAGAHVPPLRRAVRWLERAGCDGGVVAVGLCSGAWSAMCLAMADPAVRGVVLLEPELRDPAAAAAAAAGPAGRVREMVEGTSWVRLLFGERRLGLVAGRGMRRRLYEWVTSALRGSLPADASPRLVAVLAGLAERRVPTLVVTAAEAWREMYVVRALSALPAGHRIRHRSIGGTNHVFAVGGGKRRVIETVRQWLSQETFE